MNFKILHMGISFNQASFVQLKLRILIYKFASHGRDNKC